MPATQTRNPVFAREFVPQNSLPGGGSAGYAILPDSSGRTMTIDDVIVKTGLMFVVLLAGAGLGWAGSASIGGLVIVPMIIAFVLGLVAYGSRTVRPALFLLYAAFEGITLGVISRWYSASSSLVEKSGGANIVAQAVLGTLVTFAVVLVLFLSKKIRVTSRSRRIFGVALMSYMIIGLVSLIGAIFGVGSGWGFYGVGGIGLLFCGLGVALAAYSLVMDFDAIAYGVQAGFPAEQSWRAGFGLMVSLVWLYLELLRLLAILNRR